MHFQSALIFPQISTPAPPSSSSSLSESLFPPPPSCFHSIFGGLSRVAPHVPPAHVKFPDWSNLRQVDRFFCIICFLLSARTYLQLRLLFFGYFFFYFCQSLLLPPPFNCDSGYLFYFIRLCSVFLLDLHSCSVLLLRTCPKSRSAPGLDARKTLIRPVLLGLQFFAISFLSSQANQIAINRMKNISSSLRHPLDSSPF